MEKIYENDEIRVFWYPERCTHSARCLNGLPQVFNLNRRPWINVQAAPAKDIVKTIDTCPSGALKYDLPAGSPLAPESARGPGWINYKADTASLMKIKVTKNGPLVLNGGYELLNAAGELIEKGTRTSLCRCGLSQRKPYCDGTHYQQGWKEE